MSSIINNNFLTPITIPNVITFNNESFARIVNNIISIYTAKNIISSSQITIRIKKKCKLSETTTVDDLLNEGVKLFDAFIYLSNRVNKDNNIKVEIIDDDAKVTILDKSEIGKSLVALYFHLLVRANVPSGDGKVEGTDIPKFLYSILNIKLSGTEIRSNLASFDLAYLTHDWIRYINLSQFSKLFKNRLTLGIAGYRLINAFKVLKVREDVKPDILNAVEFVKNKLCVEYYWDIHPVTRDENLNSILGPLNANLSNLLLEAYTLETLTEAVKDKLIYSVPKSNLRVKNYLTWSSLTSFSLKHKIFD